MRGAAGLAAFLCLIPGAFGAPGETTPVPVPCAVSAPAGQWTAAAQWIAGISNSAYAASLAPEQVTAWNQFAKSSASDWANLRRLYLDHIEAWRSRNLADAPSNVAFYPFGGPDAANLLAFYPNAREYVMIGLEPVGCIPSSISDYTPAYFTELRHSLSSVVAMGFFKTDDMRRDVTHNTDLNGVLPLLMFLISRGGNTITNVTPIGISPEGVVAPAASLPRIETSGVAIQFSDPRHGSRTLRYFSLNLENSRLRKKTGSAKYLADLPETVTLLKAASYLLHKTYFSSVRNTILSKSRIIVEEDSGIPYRYFSPDNWDVRLFGTYAEPIQLFKNWNQQDLQAAYDSGKNIEPLDFALGYRHRGNSNLILAVRKTRQASIQPGQKPLK